MRILYLHQYYRTPEQGGGIRSWHISQALAKAGHQVTVLATHNQATRQTEDHDGVQVHLFPIAYQQHFSYRERVRAFLGYSWECSRFLSRDHEFDLVYASSTPLTVGVPALYAQKRFDLPFVFEVRDLWPQAPLEAGAISRTTYNLLRQFEVQLYQQAQGVISLSPEMSIHIQQAAPQVNLLEMPNLSDVDFFAPPPGGRLSPHTEIALAYTGTLGDANDWQSLVALGQQIGEQDLPFSLHIMADGAYLNDVQTALADIPKVHFYGYGNKEAVRDLLLRCHFSLVLFNPNMPVLSSTSPNKLFDSLAAGTPIVVNTNGWQREIVDYSQCGVYFRPGTEAALLKQLMSICFRANIWRNYSHNARLLAQLNYSTRSQLPRLVQWIENLGQ